MNREFCTDTALTKKLERFGLQDCFIRIVGYVIYGLLCFLGYRTKKSES